MCNDDLVAPLLSVVKLIRFSKYKCTHDTVAATVIKHCFACALTLAL